MSQKQIPSTKAIVSFADRIRQAEDRIKEYSKQVVDCKDAIVNKEQEIKHLQNRINSEQKMLDESVEDLRRLFRSKSDGQ